MKGVRDKRWDNLAPPFTSEQASRLRKGQLDEEVQMAKQMEQEGYQMFSPTVVCDRVAVKDGKGFLRGIQETEAETSSWSTDYPRLSTGTVFDPV